MANLTIDTNTILKDLDDCDDCDKKCNFEDNLHIQNVADDMSNTGKCPYTSTHSIFNLSENNTQFCDKISMNQYNKNNTTERELINLGKLTAEVEINERIEKSNEKNPFDSVKESYSLNEKDIIKFLDDFAAEKNSNKRNSSLLSLMFRVRNICDDLRKKKTSNNLLKSEITSLKKELKIEKETNRYLTHESDETCKELDQKDADISKCKRNHKKELEILNRQHNISYYTHIVSLTLVYGSILFKFFYK